MFMDANRKKNGATKQPGAASTGDQKSQQKLSPNLPIGDTAEDLRFTPNMGSPAQINSDHYAGGISGSGPYGTSYEDKIPYVGSEEYKKGNPELKG